MGLGDPRAARLGRIGFHLLRPIQILSSDLEGGEEETFMPR
jgi:hypothetical protein